MNHRNLQLNSRSARRFRPAFEPLEPRLCLSSSHALPQSVTVTGTSLKVSDIVAKDTILISDDGAGTIAAAILRGSKVVASGFGSGITQITVDANGYKQSLSYSLTGVLTNTETINVSLDQPSEKARLDFSPGASGATLALRVDANAGESRVTEVFGSLDNATVIVRGAYVGGHNVFDATVGGSLTASNLLFSFRGGGAGTNTLGLHMTGDIDASSLFGANIGGGHVGLDQITFDYAGVVSGQLILNMHGGGYKETMTANVTAAEGSTGSVTATMTGVSGDHKRLTMNVIDNSGGDGNPGTLAELNPQIIDHNARFDKITATDNVLITKTK